MTYFLIFLAQFALLFFLSKELTRSVSLLLFKFTGNERFAIRLFHFLFLPGVIIHELSHLLSAEVMFVKTHGMNLSPERQGDAVKMGSVQIEKTDPIRRAIIGFAPVLVGFLLISVITFYFLSARSPFGVVLSYALIFFVVFEIGNTMFSSKKDLEGTIELLIFFALILVIAYIFGFKFPDMNAFLNSAQTQEILLKGIKILFFPIAIDVVIIFLARFMIPRG